MAHPTGKVLLRTVRQKIDWTKPKDEEKTRYETRKAEERENFEKANGIRLDNMHESLRRKYGMLNEEGPDNGAESVDSKGTP